jgi:hypothetical protein
VRDFVVFASLTLSFAIFVTSHVALAARLARRERPRWRGLVAFVVPPLAAVWGFRAGLRKNAALWAFSLVVYVVALVFAKTVA